MTKLNSNETTAYTTTLLQERNEALHAAIEQLAWDTLEATGQPESDLDEAVHTDFVWGLLAKLVFRQAEGRWPEATAGDAVEAALSVTED